MNRQTDHHSPYSAEEIIRYLTGKMDRAECRMLEMAMIDDEMLADSVEGYEEMLKKEKPETLLAKLSKIPAKSIEKKEIKVIPFNWKKGFQYAVAASFVLATGWWIFNISRPQSDIEKSLVTTVQEEPNTDALDTNTHFENGNPEFNPKSVETDQSSNPKNDPLPEKLNGAVAGVKVAPAPKEEIQKSTSINQELFKPSDNQMVATSKRKLSDSEVSQSDQLPARDTGAPVVLETVTEKKADQQIEKADAKLEEVVVSGYAKAKSRNEKNFGKNNMAISYSINAFDTLKATPKGNWKDYVNDLYNSLNFKSLENPVEIYITVGAAGEVLVVDVKGAMKNADKKQLIQTIKSGQNWTNKVGSDSAKAILKVQ